MIMNMREMVQDRSLRECMEFAKKNNVIVDFHGGRPRRGAAREEPLEGFEGIQCLII